jgi:hypothetical protein
VHSTSTKRSSSADAHDDGFATLVATSYRDERRWPMELTPHHACAVDASGKLVWTQKVTNQQRVIEQLIERAHGTAEDVPLGGRFDQPSRSGRFTERTHV